MDMRSVYPSKWLKPDDLDPQGNVYVIGQVIMEAIMGEGKPVIYFRGKEKGLVLNRTNNSTLVGLFGAESNRWIDKEIILYPSTVIMNGAPQPCIRVRLNGQSRPLDPDDTVPF